MNDYVGEESPCTSIKTILISRYLYDNMQQTPEQGQINGELDSGHVWFTAARMQRQVFHPRKLETSKHPSAKNTASITPHHTTRMLQRLTFPPLVSAPLQMSPSSPDTATHPFSSRIHLPSHHESLTSTPCPRSRRTQRPATAVGIGRRRVGGRRGWKG